MHLFMAINSLLAYTSSKFGRLATSPGKEIYRSGRVPSLESLRSCKNSNNSGLTVLTSCQAADPLDRRPSRLGRLELLGGMAGAVRSLRIYIVSRGVRPAASGQACEAACS